MGGYLKLFVNPISARLFFMYYLRGGGGRGQKLPLLNFSLETITIAIKFCMMLDILLKNLSVEKNGKSTSIFRISVRALIGNL